jgi:DNA-directed RNA polymerase subunit RPC12/RpoP
MEKIRPNSVLCPVCGRQVLVRALDNCLRTHRPNPSRHKNCRGSGLLLESIGKKAQKKQEWADAMPVAPLIESARSSQQDRPPSDQVIGEIIAAVLSDVYNRIGAWRSDVARSAVSQASRVVCKNHQDWLSTHRSYVCQRCRALVVDPHVHQLWHDTQLTPDTWARLHETVQCLWGS